MSTKPEITDSPRDWVYEHTQQYLATDGAEGHIWKGAPTLVLITTGRTSGKQRRTMLIYGRDGDNYLLVASQGGAPDHPQWYKNLAANPEVQIQVLADKFTARARTATPEEKARLWPIMTAHWPAFDDYQKKTSRDIPLVILERV
jgi:deazaflavin-dependent oxidoreductase (nitroreductase family)